MAGTGNLQQLNVQDYAKGCNYSPDLTSLQPGESPNAMNIEFWNDRIRKRRGYELLAACPAGLTATTGYSVTDFGVTGSNHKQVIHIGSNVYSMQALNGSLVSLRSGAPLTRSRNAAVKNILIQTYDDLSAAYYWDGVAASMSQLSINAPGFRHALEYYGYLLACGQPLNPMRITYESTSTMINGGFNNYFTLGPAPNDDIITSTFILNGRAYIGTKYSIFRLSFVGGVTVFDYKQTVTGIGIVPNTLQLIFTLQFGQVAMFMGYDRQLYIFDGSNVRPLSEKFFYANMDTIIAMEYVDEAYRENSCAAFDPVRRTYRVLVTRKGDQTNNYMLNVNVQNLMVNQYFPAQNFGYYPYDNMKFSSMSYCYDQINRQFLIAVDYAGNVYKLFTDVTTDNGAPIVEYFDTAIFKVKEHTVTKGATLDIYFIPAGNYSLQLWERLDLDRTWQRRRPDVPMYNGRDRFIGVNGALGKNMVLGPDQEIIPQGISISSTFNNYQFRLTSGTTEGQCSYGAGTIAGAGAGTSVTGTGTAWTSDMTAANGWKLWVQTGAHKNYLYNFTYTSPTTATVSTMTGSSPTDDFTGATYTVYKSNCAVCQKGWELLLVNFDVKPTMSGHTDVQR